MTSRPPLTLVPPPDTAPPGDTVTRLDTGVAERPARTRYVGPDVVRALALIGVVVMNYHGYLILLGGRNDHSTTWATLLRPVDRAAVDALRRHLRAGRRRRRHPADQRRPPRPAGDRAAVAAQAVDAAAPRPGPVRLRADVQRHLGRHDPAVLRRHVRRVGGHLHAAQPLDRDDRRRRRTRRRRDRVVGDRAGVRRPPHLVAASPPSGSPRGLVFDVFVNGTHPLLPWLAFLCAGIILGRSLRTTWWRPVALVLGRRSCSRSPRCCPIRSARGAR